MAQQTDAQLTTDANVIGNETVEGANTTDRIRDYLINAIDSKINNDKIETDSGLATALKTVAGRDAVKAYIDGLISGESTNRNSAIATAISNLLASSPATLDTLNELALALGSDPNFATTIATTLGLKANQTSISNINNTSDANKPVSTAQQTALDLKQNLNSTFDRKTDIDYTLALTDNGKAIEMDSTLAHTLTVPLNSSVAFPVGASIPVIKYNTGTVTIVATGGVTINSSSGTLIVENRHSAALLQKVGANEWRLLNGSPALDWTTLTPTQTGIASGLGHSIKYIIEGKRCMMLISIYGTGNTLDPITITNMPFVAASTRILIIYVNNAATQRVGRAQITSGTSTLTITATEAAGAFTDNGYREANFEMTFDIQ